MNKELNAFLTAVDELLLEKSMELEAVQAMDQKQILAFGQEDYWRFLNEQIRLQCLLANFAMVGAIMVNRGTPVMDTLAGMVSRSDRSGDAYVIAVTKACCEDILERYISLEDMLE